MDATPISLAGVARVNAARNMSFPPSEPSKALVNFDRDQAIASLDRAAMRAKGAADRALAQNEEIAASNNRVIYALSSASGKDFGSDPMSWYSWWNDYNEYDRPQRQPTQYYRSTTTTTPYSLSFVGPHSCFVAGTPVWTISGLVQIEKIKKGDLVLAQDQDTGELAYKTVVETTVRQPSSNSCHSSRRYANSLHEGASLLGFRGRLENGKRVEIGRLVTHRTRPVAARRRSQ